MKKTVAIFKCGLYTIWIQKPWKADEGLNHKNSEYFPQFDTQFLSHGDRFDK